MNRTYEKQANFICTVERDDLGLTVTGWNIPPWDEAREYVEEHTEVEFCDCPPYIGEYVVRGVFLESSEARTMDYPGSYDLGVVEAEYTFLCEQPELEVA